MFHLCLVRTPDTIGKGIYASEKRSEHQGLGILTSKKSEDKKAAAKGMRKGWLEGRKIK